MLLFFFFSLTPTLNSTILDVGLKFKAGGVSKFVGASNPVKGVGGANAGMDSVVAMGSLNAGGGLGACVTVGVEFGANSKPREALVVGMLWGSKGGEPFMSKKYS